MTRMRTSACKIRLQLWGMLRFATETSVVSRK